MVGQGRFSSGIGALARVATAGICLASGGCAGLHLDQKDGDAIVRTAGFDQTFKDGPIAARLLPYALLAEQAYLKQDRLDGPPQPFEIKCPGAGVEVCALKAGLERRANGILRQYRLVADYMGPLQCKNRNGVGCNIPVSGLGIHVWRRNHASGACAEAVVTFRGTDSGSLGDWLSNFHGITRILPIHDQYEQVQDRIQEILNKINSCRKQGGQVVSTGHSLGGGLAQNAAYTDRRIRHVYAFNPSIVTAYYDVHLTQRSQNERDRKSVV